MRTSRNLNTRLVILCSPPKIGFPSPVSGSMAALISSVVWEARLERTFADFQSAALTIFATPTLTAVVCCRCRSFLLLVEPSVNCAADDCAENELEHMF